VPIISAGQWPIPDLDAAHQCQLGCCDIVAAPLPKVAARPPTFPSYSSPYCNRGGVRPDPYRWGRRGGAHESGRLHGGVAFPPCRLDEVFSVWVEGSTLVCPAHTRDSASCLVLRTLFSGSVAGPCRTLPNLANLAVGCGRAASICSVPPTAPRAGRGGSPTGGCTDSCRPERRRSPVQSC